MTDNSPQLRLVEFDGTNLTLSLFKYVSRRICFDSSFDT